MTNGQDMYGREYGPYMSSFQLTFVTNDIPNVLSEDHA